MNKILKEILIGVLLGDAHIGKTGLDKAFISFEQSKNKESYINHLFSLTKENGLALMEDSLKEYKRESLLNKSATESLYFRTQSLKALRPLADMFLDESGNKIIPSNIADHLTPRSLAYWIMDDGQQVKKGGVTLCTDSFNSNDVNILREALKTNFQLTTSIHKKKGKNDALYERIYIWKDSLQDFKTSLKPHMHESMLYKINEENIQKEVKETLKIENNTEFEVESDIDIFDL